MHFLILAEGNVEAHEQFKRKWHRRPYPGMGVNDQDAVVKLGEVKLYTMRINKNAREAVIEDMKRSAFYSLDELQGDRFVATGKKYVGPEIKRNRIFGAIQFAINRVLGFVGMKKVSLKEPRKYERFYPSNECLWKIVLAEGADREENGGEEI